MANTAVESIVDCKKKKRSSRVSTGTGFVTSNIDCGHFGYITLIVTRTATCREDFRKRLTSRHLSTSVFGYLSTNYLSLG